MLGDYTSRSFVKPSVCVLVPLSSTWEVLSVALRTIGGTAVMTFYDAVSDTTLRTLPFCHLLVAFLG